VLRGKAASEGFGLAAVLSMPAAAAVSPSCALPAAVAPPSGSEDSAASLLELAVGVEAAGALAPSGTAALVWAVPLAGAADANG
jgi:hypothetical protein